MKKAIIIGASSGIGYELAILLSKEKYSIGIAARRVDDLNELKVKLGTEVFAEYIDISKTDEAMIQLEKLIETVGEIDLMVISSGTGYINTELDFKKEKDTVDVNVSGFMAMANVAYRQFEKQGRGCLVGISSVAALRGEDSAPAYNASKAFVSNYLEGLRKKAVKGGKSIDIIDIRPGFVDTAMAQGEGMFWVAPTAIAAKQIYDAICKKKQVAYITKRWVLIAFILKHMPRRIYNKL